MTTEAQKRLRMGLILGSVAVVALILWLSSGYGLGHDTYRAPDGRFSFEYPDGYTIHTEPVDDPIVPTFSVSADGGAAITGFTVVRKTGWAKAIAPEQRAAAVQIYLNGLLVKHAPQTLKQFTVQRPYGTTQRLEVTATVQEVRHWVAMEALLRGEDLYLLSIEGPSDKILAETEGARFFEKFRIE